MSELTQRQAEYLHCIVATGIKQMQFMAGTELPIGKREATSVIITGTGTLMDVPLDDWRVIRKYLGPGGGMYAVNILHPTSDAYRVLGL